MDPNNKPQRPLRVACIGDSLTAGYTRDSDGELAFFAYGEEMARLSSGAVEVRLCATCGETSGQILARLQGEEFFESSGLSYDYAVILAGTNDVARAAMDRVISNVMQIASIAVQHSCDSLHTCVGFSASGQLSRVVPQLVSLEVQREPEGSL